MKIVSAIRRKKVEKHIAAAYFLVLKYGSRDEKVLKLRRHLVDAYLDLTDVEPYNFEGENNNG